MMDDEYKITILCPWHEVKKGGFATALSAYEHMIQMDEIARDDVISAKIEKTEREFSE